MAPITPGYFETTGISLVEGRAFESTDREGAPDVAILSKAAADLYWPGESAVGRTLLPNTDGSATITVVGVAGNVKIWSLGEAPRPYRGNAAPGIDSRRPTRMVSLLTGRE